MAARFRELSDKAMVHEKADFEKIFDSVRRNFDSGNFSRDIDNAKRKNGFFNKVREIKLSYYGQQFVDALPDREKVKALRKPKGTGRGNSKAKKKKVTKKKPAAKK